MCSQEKYLVEDFLLGKSRFVHQCHRVCMSEPLDKFIIAVIVANTITLAMDYQGISEQQIEHLAIANIVFSSIFALEMILKLIGETPLTEACVDAVGVDYHFPFLLLLRRIVAVFVHFRIRVARLRQELLQFVRRDHCDA